MAIENAFGKIDFNEIAGNSNSPYPAFGYNPGPFGGTRFEPRLVARNAQGNFFLNQARLGADFGIFSDEPEPPNPDNQEKGFDGPVPVDQESNKTNMLLIGMVIIGAVLIKF